jgi:hypothetical protein
MDWEREDYQRELQEDHQAGDREASSRDFQRVADLVEVSAPSEAEEKPTSSVIIRRAGTVGAPATRDRFSHGWKKERKTRKTFG